MTIKTISGTYADGYVLAPEYAGARITRAGSVTNSTGAAGASHGGAGEAGGAALALPTGGHLANSGLVRGGAGGQGNDNTDAFGLGGVGGSGGAGVVLSAIGSVTNRAAIFGGAAGAGGAGGPGYYVAGFGGRGGIGGDGMILSASGVVNNQGDITGGAGGNGGAPGNENAAFGAGGAGGVGVVLSNGGAVENTGTIRGGAGGLGGHGRFVVSPPGPQGVGVLLSAGGSVTNASASSVIEGDVGVQVTGTGQVTNFGTIAGAGGDAVVFGSSADVLVVEAGSAFVGAVLGGGGTLDLDTGTGTITGNLAGGSATVSGSMAATTFQNFNTVEIGAAAIFITSGAVTIGAAQRVVDFGSLTLGGKKAAIVNDGMIAVAAGILTVKGAVTGSGQATIAGGLLDFTSSFNQKVTFSGNNGTFELAHSRDYTATITGFSKTGGTVLDLADIRFVGSGEATFAGDTTSGVLTVTDGAHTAHITLIGDYTGSTFIASDDGNGGVSIIDPAKSQGAPATSPHRFIAAMAGLVGSAGWTTHTTEAAAAGEPVLMTPRAMTA